MTLPDIQRQLGVSRSMALQIQEMMLGESLAEPTRYADSFELLIEARKESECHTPKTMGYSQQAKDACTEGFMAGYTRGYRAAENHGTKLNLKAEPESPYICGEVTKWDAGETTPITRCGLPASWVNPDPCMGELRALCAKHARLRGLEVNYTPPHLR